MLVARLAQRTERTRLCEAQKQLPPLAATLGYGDLSEMEITAIVPESEIYRLKKWDNARVHFYHPNGPVTMAIRSVEFEMSAGMDSGWVEARVRGVIE